MALILLIEDDLAAQRLLTVALQKAGHTVQAHTHGEPGVAAATTGDASLLISDYNLPDVDGLEVLRRVRKQRPLLPVIFLSGDTRPETREQALAIGATACLDKPFKLGELLPLVQSLLPR